MINCPLCGFEASDESLGQSCPRCRPSTAVAIARLGFAYAAVATTYLAVQLDRLSITLHRAALGRGAKHR